MLRELLPITQVGLLGFLLLCPIPAASQSLTATWQDNSANPCPSNPETNCAEDEFILERCTGDLTTCAGGPFVEVGRPPQNSTSWIDSNGLSYSTDYTYRIGAVNAQGQSGWSNFASAQTLAPPPPPDTLISLTCQQITEEPAMAVSVISSETITWAAGANPAGQSITIPGDATAVYMLWTYWVNANGSGLASVTLGGNSPDESTEAGTTTGGFVATGVAAWYNPSTGSQTLDPAWDSAPAEGPTTIVVYVKGGDTTAWRDAQIDQAEEFTSVSVTLSGVQTTDLVLAYDQRYTTNPGLMPGYTSVATQSNNNEGSRAQYDLGLSGSVSVQSQDEYYSSLVAIAIPEGAAATSSFLPLSRRSQRALLVR